MRRTVLRTLAPHRKKTLPMTVPAHAAPRFLPGEKLALGLCFVFLLWANRVTPLWADDYCRTIPFSPRMIFHIVWGNYFFWTGRWFITLVTFFILDLHHYGSLVAFAVVNAGVFVFLVHVVVHMCRREAGHEPRPSARTGFVQCLLVFLMLWWLPRTIAEVALWKTGAIGYLWGVTGEMWILSRLLAGRARMNVAQYGAVFLIATAMESISLLMALFVLGWAAWAWKNSRPVPWALAVSHALGTFTLGVAPGNYMRARFMTPSTLPDRLDGLTGNLGSLFDPFWVPFVLLIGIGLFMGRRQLRFPACLRCGRGWMFAALALAYMLLLLIFPREALAARVSYPASVFLVCYLACLLFSCPVGAVFSKVMAVTCTGLAVMHLAIVIPDLTLLARISHDWAVSTQAQVARDQPVVLHKVTMGPRHKLLYVHKDIIFVGINPDPRNQLTMCYAWAMGASSVRAVP
ncbi:hypothetical protein AA15237_0002 [Komagataeibacter xylinus NBRC 15237]|nr:hypothetical protein AA15237_0002 [Komagataeibacter xylinus NBRC 15237]